MIESTGTAASEHNAIAASHLRTGFGTQCTQSRRQCRCSTKKSQSESQVLRPRKHVVAHTTVTHFLHRVWPHGQSRYGSSSSWKQLDRNKYIIGNQQGLFVETEGLTICRRDPARDAGPALRTPQSISEAKACSASGDDAEQSTRTLIMAK